MASRAFILLLLVSLYGSIDCKVKGWPPGWSWSHPQLTDEEIVDLLYTDPDRLRELTAGYDEQSGFDVSQDISVPSTGIDDGELDHNLPPSIQNSYVPPSRIQHGRQATSFTSVQHYTPKSGTSGPQEDLLSYSQLIVH